MDFNLSEDQQQIQSMVRDFAVNEIAPVIKEFDEKQEFPRDIVRQLGELGMLGILFPSEYGGAELDYVSYVLILEELARVDPSTCLTVAAHNSLCSNHIFTFGKEEQKKKYLTPLASGEKLGAWALTEPGSGSDAGGLTSTAVKKGDHYILNGTKTFITNSTVSEIAVVLALTDKEKKTRGGISSFIIDYGTPGFRPGKKEDKLGCRSSDTGELIMEDCEVPAENLLGNEGDGFKAAMGVLDGGRISIALMSLGLAQGAFDLALDYARKREQFGQLIFNFQGNQWKFAEMATEIQAARLLTLQAARMKDENKRVTTASAMAKLFAGDLAVKVASEAVQVLGGYGFSKEYVVEKFFRDARLVTIGEGTSEIQKLVIARSLMD